MEFCVWDRTEGVIRVTTFCLEDEVLKRLDLGVDVRTPSGSKVHSVA